MTGIRASEPEANKPRSVDELLLSGLAVIDRAFDEAKALEARWKIVEREQRELHQVSLLKVFVSFH